MPLLRPDEVLRYLAARGFLSAAEVELVQSRWNHDRDGPLLPFLAAESLLPQEVASDLAILIGNNQLEGLEPHLPGLVLLSLIGRGGRGSVYRAWQPSLRRVVAVKVLSRALSGNREYVQRFIREARVASRVSHRNIVRAFDINKKGADVYMVMEYVSGISLGAVLRDRAKLAVRQGLEIGRLVGEAVSYIARADIVHRDIKPDNIMIDRQGRVKLCDLGLARPSGEGNLTSPMVAQGTPAYMAPEAALGAQLTSQADVYSLGVTLVRVLTGQLPFDHPDPVELLRMHVEDEPRGLDENGLPGAVNVLLARMLAKAPTDRPPAREIGRELTSLQRALPGTESPNLYELVPGGAPAASLAYTSELDVIDTAELPAEPEVGPVVAVPSAPAAPVLARKRVPVTGLGLGTLAAALVICLAYIVYAGIAGPPQLPADPRVPQLEAELADTRRALDESKRRHQDLRALLADAARRMQLEHEHDLRALRATPRHDAAEDIVPEIEAMRRALALPRD